MSLLKNKFIIALIAVVLITVLAISIPQSADSESAVTVTTSTTQVDKTDEIAKKLQEKAFIRYMNIKKLNETIWINKTNENIFYAKLAEIEDAKRKAAEAKRIQEQKATKAAKQQEPTRSASNGRCGGNLPPCCVMERESGGNITAQNPTSSASGKWQFISSTWGNYMGYPTAASAPEWVQDKRAAELWANGAGASHWGGGC